MKVSGVRGRVCSTETMKSRGLARSGAPTTDRSCTRTLSEEIARHLRCFPTTERCLGPRQVRALPGRVRATCASRSGLPTFGGVALYEELARLPQVHRETIQSALLAICRTLWTLHLQSRVPRTVRRLPIAQRLARPPPGSALPRGVGQGTASRTARTSSTASDSSACRKRTTGGSDGASGREGR
jgi:hypothetical protein